MRILLIEDDLSLITGLSLALNKQGYELKTSRTVQEAYDVWSDSEFDLVLLDVTLPDGSGFDICRKIRLTSKIPIIFLTASDEEISITTGLDIGGDDYITKPFKLAVLISRINAILRRSKDYSSSTNSETELNSGGIKIDLLKGLAFKNNAPLDLTAGEYRLLRLFMQNPNVILSAKQILSKLWDCNENFVDSNTLTVYIRRLRTKVEDNPSEPKMIVTVRRMGYKWSVPE